MKFLLVLSMLATTTVFAQRMDHDRWVKCYDTAQGNDMEVVYKMKKHDHYINLVYPQDLAQQLEVRHDCLASSRNDTNIDNRWIKFCPTDGQRIKGLVPVDVSMGQDDQQEDETVYCEKEIVKWIKWGQPDLY